MYKNQDKKLNKKIGKIAKKNDLKTGFVALGETLESFMEDVIYGR
jgi:hypothetical protein